MYIASTECQTIMTAMLMVMSDMDSHMISNPRLEIGLVWLVNVGQSYWLGWSSEVDSVV
jgi:hypothetical protein